MCCVVCTKRRVSGKLAVLPKVTVNSTPAALPAVLPQGLVPHIARPGIGIDAEVRRPAARRSVSRGRERYMSAVV